MNDEIENPASPLNADAAMILRYLTDQQHLHPHAPLAHVLETSTQQLGCCPAALARAATWLRLDPSRAIGRLRRSELMQLANAVHRFWMQSAGAPTSATR